MRARASILSVLLACAAPAVAQDTVLYKCTDAKGNTSLQNNQPCAPGMQQEIRRIGQVRTVPVPAMRPAPPPPPQAPVPGDFVLVSGPNMKRTPAPESAALPAPPPLYQCKTWDGATYFGETDSPEPRCVPLQVTGIDGNAQLGAGSACEMKPDQCESVPEAQACEAWLRRLDEAEFKANYSSDADRSSRQAAFADIKAKVEASRCSPVAPATPANPVP